MVDCVVGIVNLGVVIVGVLEDEFEVVCGELVMECEVFEVDWWMKLMW